MKELDPAAVMNDVVTAHGLLKSRDIARSRALTMEERSALLMSACEATAVLYRSRIAAGLPPPPRDPWPASTWEFLRKHAARVCK